MLDPILFAIAFVFMLAGFVKGVIGMALPTIVIGLLATSMPPAHAIAIVIVPAILTNIWQTFSGPYLKDIVRRLWPLLLCTCLGVWSGMGFLSGPYAPYGTILLGILLVVYSIVALARAQFYLPKGKETWIGAVCGYVSGLIAAATGVQAIPTMPYLQALGMERDEFIQALGVFFTTSTTAMLFNLSHAGFLTRDVALPSALGLATALIGMYLGQTLRRRLPPETFRRWFLYSMIALGAYLAINKIVQLHLL
ncbi:Sulfite exporter TauE/SafE [Afipia felis]|jgi:uncharacterized membrane protein YfcA|uniref:Probable membrane transporter protein n=1 Tax=Afipia felis TaxID=1035 RepID=A0A090N6I9_AFIFE|nr:MULTISPECIES: sulfite exporter TauE/SafE family protein [Afipia]EFI52486.1 protein of unknown function DUF81 [Afipia sp. 1NLS2]RTL74759.1 MAG: sulfite exporter TauE/SafE family protein [Bradyrhizobiaceae bacterium]CEG06933.1 Sulfite exporter TauE/SafE [Afipia felis]